jgi:hypothetical protein
LTTLAAVTYLKTFEYSQYTVEAAYYNCG